MQTITFNFHDSANISWLELNQEKLKLKSVIELLQNTKKSWYEHPAGFINLPFDEQLHTEIKKLVEQKQVWNIKHLFIIGIGGSNLGTWAIYQALSAYTDEKKVHFIDTVDAQYMNILLQKMTEVLHNDQEVLVILVTKSGTTTETIANSQICIEQLKKLRPDTYQNYVVVVTDKHSALDRYAHAYGYDVLYIPRLVGGRYSVLSAAGLYVLAFIGIDIDLLLQGARDITDTCLSDDIEKNMAMTSALIKAIQYKKGFAIHNQFLFNPSLEMLGKWYRQLMAESLGKKRADEVPAGILPIVSIGTTDLHSIGQLFLGGPNTIFTTFITVKNLETDVFISSDLLFPDCVTHLEKKGLHQIMNIIANAVMQTYKEEARPFCSLEFPELSAYFLGQFLQLSMIEMVYLASLLQVNPFDQPQVELYKKNVRKILAYE